MARARTVPARQGPLERVRSLRVHPERDLSLESVMDSVAKDLRRRARSVGVLGGAWQELAPAGLVERTSVVGLSRGVLTVRVEDASTKFEIDRWLRSGGEMALVKRSPTTLTRVRLVM